MGKVVMVKAECKSGRKMKTLMESWMGYSVKAKLKKCGHTDMGEYVD